MDLLPTELVLKILKKTNPPTIYKWKYQNKRISYIITKYLRYYEVEVLRFSWYIRTATLHNGEEFQLYPTSVFPRYLQRIAKKIESKTAVIDRILLHNIKITGTSKSNDINLVFPNIQMVKHLEITNVTFETDDLLRWYLKIYQVESLVLDSIKFDKFGGSFWEKMLDSHHKMQHLCLSRLHLKFDSYFLKFIELYEVPYVSLTAYHMKFSFEMFLNSIQYVLDRSVPINWSFFVKHPRVLYYDYKLQTFEKFISKNGENIVKITEERSETTGIQMIHIKFRCGQVQFPITGSYLRWKDPNRWAIKNIDFFMEDKHREYIVYFLIVMFILALLAYITL